MPAVCAQCFAAFWAIVVIVVNGTAPMQNVVHDLCAGEQCQKEHNISMRAWMPREQYSNVAERVRNHFFRPYEFMCYAERHFAAVLRAHVCTLKTNRHSGKKQKNKKWVSVLPKIKAILSWNRIYSACNGRRIGAAIVNDCMGSLRMRFSYAIYD